MERSPLDINASTMNLLHLAKQRANELFATRIGALKLTSSQHMLLTAIRDNPGKSQTELVAITGIDRSTLADIISRLQSRNLLKRKRLKHDARAYSVQLSEEGEEIMRRAAQAAEAVDTEILSGLPCERRDEFLKDLRVILGERLGGTSAHAKSSLPATAQAASSDTSSDPQQNRHQ